MSPIGLILFITAWFMLAIALWGGCATIWVQLRHMQFDLGSKWTNTTALFLIGFILALIGSQIVP
jgi:hypothetical protein